MPATVAPLVLAFPTRLPAIRLTSASGAAAPVTSWIQVAVAGDYEDKRYGQFAITTEMLSAMVLNFSSGKFPVPPTEICVDYDHLTTKASQVPGDGKAAGWFKQLETRDDGTTLWARVEWTAAGAEAIASNEYRFFSPYFTSNYEDQNGDELGPCLINGAVTNRPFLQGMQPLSLALSRQWKSGYGAGVYVQLTTLTDNDKKARLETAVQQRFGAFSSDTYGYSSWDTWLVDTIEGVEAVFYRSRSYYIVGYTFADDGSVTFTGDPVEVVNNWARLGALNLETDPMSKKTFSLTAADGKTKFEIAEDQLEGTDLVKALRAQLPAVDAKVLSKAEFEAMDATMKALGASVEALKTESAANQAAADKATKALAQSDAEKKVEALVTAGKVTPAQRETYVELALSNAEMFTKLTGTLPVIVKLDTVVGGGQDILAGAKDTQLAAKAAALRQADPKLSAEAAVALALEQNPDLYQG